MTPLEKWQRMTNPTCVEDYAIGISFAEIAQVPEALAEITRDGSLSVTQAKNKPQVSDS
jgi:hypothetical protein